MVFWFVAFILVAVVMLVASSLIHDRYHKKNTVGTCAYCGGVRCTNDHHFVETGGGERCPFYTYSFPYWATRIVIILALFSPLFLEFNKLGMTGTSYTFKDGKYEKIRFVALDIPGISKILNVPNSVRIYTDSQIVTTSANRVRILTPRFTWQYNQNPEVFGEIPNRPTFVREEDKPILEFILRNESALRSMISSADIKSPGGRKQLFSDMQRLVRSDISVHGYKFDLIDFSVYEY